MLGIIQEDIPTVELVDATDPGEHNGDTVTDVEAGLASRTNPLDDSTSQANVSIPYKANGEIRFSLKTINCGRPRRERQVIMSLETPLGRDRSKDSFLGRSRIGHARRSTLLP